jgi:acyl-CoA synthetase (AMP-forming)/AMP-acid ligase II
MQLTPDDIVCSPLPLFHGFGIIVALLASLSHGSSVVFPSDRCDPHATLEVIQDYTPTTLLGVPTMFLAEIEAMRAEELNTSLRKAVVGGSPVSSALVKNLRTRMKIREIFVAYGMTETGLTFMGNLDDQEDELSGLVGHVMPHICAKVLDNNGRTVRPGQKGELCTSGYSLQEGYYNNETKTSEVMTRDNKGRLWMHTGDEAIIYENGYCRVIGRIKDIIIRGKYAYPQLLKGNRS